MNKLKKSNFVKDVGITTLGQITVMLFTFLMNKVISTKLGPAQYMEYSLIHKTAGVITYVMILSLGIALPRYLAIYRLKGQKDKEYTTFISAFILVGISTTVVLLLSVLFKSQFSSIVFGQGDKYVSYVFPMLMLALQMGLTTLLYSFYRGIDDFFKYSFSQCIVSIGLLIISILYDKLLPMVYLMSGFGLLFSFLSFFKIWREYKNEGCSINKSDTLVEIKELSRYSLPRVPGEFILFSFTTVPLIIINQKIGGEQAVAFSVSLAIMSAISPFFRYIGMVLLPYASKSMANRDYDDLDRKIKYLSGLYLIISVLGIGFVLLFTNFVIRLLFSSEYIQYASIIRIVIFSLLPNSMYLLLRNPLDALTKLPINTINLSISFFLMNLMLYLSNTEVAFAFSFVISYTILGVLSVVSWIFLKKKREN